MSWLDDSQITTYYGGSIASAPQALLDMLKNFAEKEVQKYVGYDILQGTKVEYLPMGDLPSQSDALIEGFELVGNRAQAYGRAVTSLLALKHLPIRSVTSLYENPAAMETAGGSWSADHLLTEGTDFSIDLESEGLCWTGFLRRRGAWSPVPRSIKVTYVGGLSAGEMALTTGDYPEFVMAGMHTLDKYFNEIMTRQGAASGTGASGAVVAESLANWSITYDGNVSAALCGLDLSMPNSAKRILEERVSMHKFLR